MAVQMQAKTAAMPPHRLADRLASLLRDHAIAVLAIYFLVQMLVRTLLGAPANLDEAEQLAIADHFAFGYGPHPPLYQWLQTAGFAVFGINFLAIAFVKNAILFGTWASLFWLGRIVAGNAVLAAIGSFGLLFSANFSWESQIDHTHTVANTFLVVLTAAAMFKLLQKQSLLRHALLGLAIGLGLVAKYNFALFLVAIIAAFATDRRARAVVFSPMFAFSLALGLLIATPHYLYILDNPVAGAAKLGNLGINRFGFLQTRIIGLGAFASALAGTHGVWLALIGLGWLDRKTAARPRVANIAPDHRHSAQLLLRLWLTLLAVFAGLVIFGGTTSFRDHWLQPEAVLFPLAAAIWFSSALDATAFRRLAVAAAVLLALIPAMVGVNKRLLPGVQRDAAMPDPAGIAQIEPRIASGELPLWIAAEEGRQSWYGAGHLRYWLQIRVPSQMIEQTPPPNDRHALVFFTALANPKTAPAYSARNYGEPLPLPFFRPEQVPPQTSGKWYLAITN